MFARNLLHLLLLVFIKIIKGILRITQYDTMRISYLAYDACALIDTDNCGEFDTRCSAQHRVISSAHIQP